MDDINTRCEVRSPVDIILYWKQKTPTQNENVTLCPSDQSDQSDDSCIKGKLIPSNEVKSGNVYMFTIFNQSSVFKVIIVYDLNHTIYNETVEVDIDQCWQTGKYRVFLMCTICFVKIFIILNHLNFFLVPISL